MAAFWSGLYQLFTILPRLNLPILAPFLVGLEKQTSSLTVESASNVQSKSLSLIVKHKTPYLLPPKITMTLDQVVIIGAGVSGVAAALAFCQIGVPVSIYELKDGPATIGGALNLTPNALRYLDSWGVLTRLQARGYQVSNIDTFSMLDGTKTSRLSYVDSDNKPKYGYRVMRILRKDLQVAMLETLEAFGVKVAFNKKLSGISETVQGVRATFSDGTNVDAQLLVGCDGIHSRTRTTFVEPGREPIFTNKAIAMGLIDASTLTEEIHFEDTSVNMSQIGSLIASYCDRERKQIFFGSILSVKGEQSRDGWRVRGADQEQLKKDIEATFKGAQPPCLIEMIQKVNDLSLYPIYKLPPGGKWSRGAVILLGDAVHAVSI